jgi:hypothetical protein
MHGRGLKGLENRPNFRNCFQIDGSPSTSPPQEELNSFRASEVNLTMRLIVDWSKALVTCLIVILRP